MTVVGFSSWFLFRARGATYILAFGILLTQVRCGQTRDVGIGPASPAFAGPLFPLHLIFFLICVSSFYYITTRSLQVNRKSKKAELLDK